VVCKNAPPEKPLHCIADKLQFLIVLWDCHPTIVVTQMRSDDIVLDLCDQLEEIHTLARHSLNLKQVYRKRHYDLTAKSRQFKPGDAVWVHDTIRKPGVCSKVFPNIDDLVYLVKGSAHSPVKSIHIDRLTAYKSTNLPSRLICQRKELTSQ